MLIREHFQNFKSYQLHEKQDYISRKLRKTYRQKCR